MKRLMLIVLVSSLAAGVSAWLLSPLGSTTAHAQQHDGGAHGKAPRKGHGKVPPGGSKTPPVAPVVCGGEGQTPCPLQGWMQDHSGPAAEAGDATQLAALYDQIAGMSPDPAWNTGATGWRQISEDGATKARAGDVRGAKAACKACHTQWRDRYKAEHRHDAVHLGAPATHTTTTTTTHGSHAPAVHPTEPTVSSALQAHHPGSGAAGS